MTNASLLRRTSALLALGLLLPSVAAAGLFDSIRARGCDDGCEATANCTTECADGCRDTGCSTGHCHGCSDGCSKCPDDYRCKLEVDVEDVERDCYVVTCEPVCIPPVSCGRSDHCNHCGGRRACGADGSGHCVNGCDAAGCDTSCAAPAVIDCDLGCDDGGCDGSECGQGCGKGGLRGLLSRMCGEKSDCGRVRIVHRLGSESKPDGTECVYKWSAVDRHGNCRNECEQDCDNIW